MSYLDAIAHVGPTDADRSDADQIGIDQADPGSAETGPVSGERLDEVWTTSEGEALFRDRQGQPMTLRQFNEAASDLDYRLVARTRIEGDCANIWGHGPAGDCEVITSWLGTDQGFGFEPALIFGTIVRHGGQFDERSERFSPSEEHALATHARMAAKLGQGARSVEVDFMRFTAEGHGTIFGAGTQTLRTGQHIAVRDVEAECKAMAEVISVDGDSATIRIAWDTAR